MDASWVVRGFAALGMSMLACLPAQAQDADSIARIERGLRPAVAIQGAKLETRTLAAEMTRLNVPGVSVAVIRGGKIAWAKGYGVTHANGAPVTPQTLFQAASISKPVAAMAALKMVEAGQLELDADINTVLTSWKLPPGPAKRPATLRQLLSHTAGTTVSGFRGYAAGAPGERFVQRGVQAGSLSLSMAGLRSGQASSGSARRCASPARSSARPAIRASMSASLRSKAARSSAPELAGSLNRGMPVSISASVKPSDWAVRR